jgi:phosphatidylserine/phosphatidylglycerophosphate/cardiolipin synthase-like enzyme
VRQPVALTDRSPYGRPIKGEQYVRIARNLNVVADIARGDACYREHSIDKVLLAAIRASRRFIYIEDQYLGNLVTAAAIRDRLPNLQHVTIVVPHPTIETDFAWRRQRFLKTVGFNNDTKGKVKVFYRYNKDGKRFGPFSYIHSKTWVFDDEVAIIGSANCNRRGWGFDSEVVAAILDKPSSTSWPPASFAQKLRVALWTMHLGVDEKQLLNGYSENVRKLWDDPPSKASVLPYFIDPDFDYRASPLWLLLDPREERSWDLVDPDGARIKACG